MGKSEYILGVWTGLSKFRVSQNINQAGLSKVAGCQWKSPPTWLVLAGYSARHFFTDGVFSIPELAAYFDNSAVYFKTFWQPWPSIKEQSELESELKSWLNLDCLYAWKFENRLCGLEVLQNSILAIYNNVYIYCI